jgi:hypothetical protein
MLCSVVHPKLDVSDQRYETAAESEPDADPRLMRYKIESEETAATSEGEERRGVLHLVQGWIQRLQPEKVCCRSNC